MRTTIRLRDDLLRRAKKRAAAEGKPIAWIASLPENLTPHPKPMAKGSHAATTYAFLALRKETVIIFSDAMAENHQGPKIVDEALHTPDPHYNIPGVIILTPSLSSSRMGASAATAFKDSTVAPHYAPTRQADMLHTAIEITPDFAHRSIRGQVRPDLGNLAGGKADIGRPIDALRGVENSPALQDEIECHAVPAGPVQPNHATCL
jgi:hypothetical protein